MCVCVIKITFFFANSSRQSQREQAGKQSGKMGSYFEFITLVHSVQVEEGRSWARGRAGGVLKMSVSRTKKRVYTPAIKNRTTFCEFCKFLQAI